LNRYVNTIHNCSFYGPVFRSCTDAPVRCIVRAEKHKEVKVMANGTVKWFNTTKGYGFIAPEGGSKDVFVHISAVERSGLTGLADNQKVTFDIEAGRDGRESAVNLALAD
jgi:CspA family cold shock protein